MRLISRQFALEGVWVVAGQISSVVGLLISLRVLTGILPPTAFGEFTLGLTVAFFANQIIYGPIANGIARHYAIALQAEQTSAYLQASRNMLLRALSCTVALGLITATLLAAADNSKWAGIVLAATALAASSGYSSSSSALLTAARQRSAVAIQQGIEPWIKLACAVLGTQILGAHGGSPLLGYALGHAITGIALHVVTNRLAVPPSSHATPASVWSRQIWNYAKPFLVFAAFTWANISSDRWALQHFAGSQEVGLYAAAFMLGYSPMSTVSAVLVQLAAPVIYQSNSSHSNDPTEAARVAKRQCDLLAGSILAITILAWLIAALLHEQIFRVFIAPDYQHASVLMPWMILAGGIFAAGEAAAVFLNSSMKTHLQIKPKIITALIGICLNVALASLYQAKGVVFSMLAFSVLYFVWLRYIVHKQTSSTVSPSNQETSCAVS